MRTQDILTGGLLVLAGFIAGNLDSVVAQEAESGDSHARGPWEIHTKILGDYNYYAIKHNTVTGEALVFWANGKPDDDFWYPVPVGELEEQD